MRLIPAFTDATDLKGQIQPNLLDFSWIHQAGQFAELA